MDKPEFRAWNKEEKVMDKFANFGEFCNCYQSLERDVVLLQYVGLKDIKGNKIFIGDIISFVSVPTIVGEIKFGEIAEGEEELEATVLAVYMQEAGHPPRTINSHSKFLKIGTVYENPELLIKKD